MNSVKKNYLFATFCTIPLVFFGMYSSAIVVAFLPLHASRFVLAAGIATVTAISSIYVFRWCSRNENKKQSRRLFYALHILPLMLLVCSISLNQITFSRFGFTTYGAIPILFLDVTVNQNGGLGFRPKTHRITRNELLDLATEGVEIVIVGIGWDSVAKVDEDATQLGNGVEVQIMPTPEAFEAFNALVKQGKSVVLLAHTTC